MLKRSITYTNPFTEQEVTETHYFHISKADLIRMEMSEHADKYVTKGGEELTGMRAKLSRMIECEDGKAIITELESLIRMSYGLRQDDRFVKSQAIIDEFCSTEAYSQLIFELCTDEEKALEFQAGIIPSGLEAAAIREAALAQINGAETVDMDDPAENGQVKTDDVITTRQREIEGATPDTPVTLTREEVIAMGSAQIQEGVASGKYKL